jgi:glutamate-1-semialdehyde 2,1-aminomutase
VAATIEYDATEAERFRARTRRSRELHERTLEVIPTGHAGGMSLYLPGNPITVDRADGCWIWDVDGNRYLDLRLGDWVLIHGHCDEDVNRAVREQMTRAWQIGAPEWDLGQRMASILCERTPSIEKVRFFASGTDANLCALRLARAFTGRTKVAKAIASYHGTADVLLAGTSLLRPGEFVPVGVPERVEEDIVEIPFNDPDAAEAILEREGEQIAALLVEPVMTAAGMIEARAEFLQRLRAVTERHGIVLIFDEVVTYPVAYGGGQAHFGVTPDLTTLAKAIGGGLPASAVGGRAEIMDLLEPEAHGGKAPMDVMATFGGNLLAMAAGIACLEKLTPEAHEQINGLAARTRARIDEIGERNGVPLHATGLGHLIGMHWAEDRVVDYETRLGDDREKIANIMLTLNNEGYYSTFTGFVLLSTAIGDQEVDGFLTALERAIRKLGYA